MATGLAALRILVVDDSKQMCTIVGTVLAAAGVGHLHYASDGKRGLEIIGQYPIDVTYVDHEMPLMNGLDFISAVRGLASASRFMPIIMLTGHSDRVHLDAARDRGVTEFLCKPVTARTILTRLDTVVMKPRPFVDAPTYFGPNRRRTSQPNYSGPFRRATDASAVLAV